MIKMTIFIYSQGTLVLL